MPCKCVVSVWRRRRAYAVVAAVGERGVAAPLDALVGWQLAGALPLEVEQRVGQRGAVVGLAAVAGGDRAAAQAAQSREPSSGKELPHHATHLSHKLVPRDLSQIKSNLRAG